jgi:hypothetical protein
MASYVFTEGSLQVSEGDATWSTTGSTYMARLVGVLPLISLTSLDTVTGIGTDATLSSLSIVKEDASTRVLFKSSNVSWTSIATGSTIVAVVFYRDMGADSLAIPLCVHDVTDTPTNGGTVSLTLSSGIVFSLTN